jgi:diphosphate-dependent phosphofructokinase
MGTLIAEINEILSHPFEGEVAAFVESKLTPDSKRVFNFLPDAISEQLLLDRDPHGNVQVAKIDTEKLLILLMQQELEKRASNGLYGGRFSPQAHYFGYEGRCALPSNFDSSYCYALGLNAAVLVKEGVNGYMSCITNLADKNPSNWVAAGCPLPTMMGIERRKGKDKPVITKALVELDSAMFKAYESVRSRWAFLDCYVSIGPIQFKGPGSDEVNFMVSPPSIS